MTFIQIITSQLVPEPERMATVDKLFGIQYALKVEPTVFRMAEHIAPQYFGGYWNFHTLSNDGFYLAPRADTLFAVNCENGFEGELSSDALGIAACLYAYSHLSFGADKFAELCAHHYHYLREYMFEHPEVKTLLRTID